VQSPIKVVDLEVSQPLPVLDDLVGYKGLQGLVRLQGVPLGYVDVPVVNHRCCPAQLSRAIVEQYSWAICQRLLQRGLLAGRTEQQRLAGLSLAALAALPLPEFAGDYPLITVAVCTRDRPEALATCLAALAKLDYPQLDILVVDNAPSSDATQQLVEASSHPQVRYICEPRPGLDWARNRALIEAQGEIIAYTDDDVIVDPGWTKAIAQTFSESPEIMAVTGLVVPYALETEAQILFEMQGGFGKGFDRQQYRIPPGQKTPWFLVGTGNFGTGANMAFRRSLFAETGGFNPALDVGTVTQGAGDLEMFFRVLKAGYELVYEPRVLVRHQHRSDYAKLKSQLTNNGSVLAYCDCARRAYPEERWTTWQLALTWLLTWHCRRLISGLLHPKQFPLELVWAEFRGWFISLNRYGKAFQAALEINQAFADNPAAEAHQQQFPHYFPHGSSSKPLPQRPGECGAKPGAIAIRELNLEQPLQPITDVLDYPAVRLFVSQGSSVLGSVDLYNQYRPVERRDLARAIALSLWNRLLWHKEQLSDEACYRRITTWMSAYLQPELPQALSLELKEASLGEAPPYERQGEASGTSISIIIGTCDRPEDLRNCLISLQQQRGDRSPEVAGSVEIIVVDNNPGSGLTPPVVSDFPDAILVSEPRKGVAYARNAGIAASQGDIIITTDDDVTMTPGWLERLTAPFARADVMAVTGNILPIELETPSQQLFEEYGGLGRGFETFEVGQEWFERSAFHVVPTWELGGTANAAFRASLFRDPAVGLMAEPLGPGMPSGVGEDIYLFYKILKAGHTIIYKGDACVWHRHRRTLAALRRQLYNYSKGFVSYNLTTLIQDRDLRVLFNLFFYLPLYHWGRIRQRLQNKISYPISLVALEIAGNLAGPWSLWRSHRRVKQVGRSQPLYASESAASESAESTERSEQPQPLRIDPPSLLRSPSSVD